MLNGSQTKLLGEIVKKNWSVFLLGELNDTLYFGT